MRATLHFIPTFLFSLFSTFIFSQANNMDLIANWDVPGFTFNDIWGWVDCDGNEYALMGSNTDIHFIDLTDHTNPVEVDRIAGGQSTSWRDVKAYGKYAYSVCDACNEGLMIFDLSDMPNSVALVKQTTEFFARAHNIFIDEDEGLLYAVGTNTRNNGIIVLDLTVTPDDPTQLASVAMTGGYIHDIFVKDNTAYASHGNPGFYVYDVNDPANPILLGSLDGYPEEGYNHASWLHPNGEDLVFADETHGKSVKLVDVSDFSNMQVTGLFKSTLLAPTHTNSIAHNPFIRDDYAVVSYYHDGVQIWDISNASSITLVAGYDTYLPNTNYNGFSGCWGVYPFLPSGKIIASDRTFGLYVLEPTSFSFTPGTLPTPPNANITTSGPTSFCEGETVELTVDAGYQFYTWIKDGTTTVGTSNSVTVSESGDYHVEICDGPCEVISSTMTVTVNQIPSVALNVPPFNSICEGEILEISVPPGAEDYQWFKDGVDLGINSNSIFAQEDGVYYVTASNGDCSRTSDDVELVVEPNPGADLNVTGSVEICEDETLELITTSIADEYYWYKDGLLFETGVTSVIVEEEATYFLQTENGNCTNTSAPVELSLTEYPDVTLNVGAVNEICDGQILNIEVASGADDYTWLLNGTTVVGNTHSIFVDEPGDYHVIAENSGCESVSDVATVIVNDYPDVTLNVPTFNEMCEDESFFAEVPAGADNYDWYWNGILQPPSGNTYLIAAAGDYFVIASNADCESTSETITVDVVEYPNVELSVDLYNEICEDENLLIEVAYGADEYEWFLDNIPLNEPTNILLVNASGNYHVVAKNADCESVSETAEVAVFEYPFITLDANSYNEICDDETFTITANSTGNSIQWFKDGTLLSQNSNSITVSESGDYHAIASNADCDAMSETVTLNVLTYPDVTLNAPTYNEICEDQLMIISVPAGAQNYDWFKDGVSMNINSNSITVELGGNYHVEASNGDCSAISDLTEVVVIEYPDVTLQNALNLEICEDGLEEISIPTGADEYEWYYNNVSLNQNSNSLNINAEGDYFVVAANGDCVVTSETVNLEVTEYPEVVLNVSPFNEICEDETLLIEVSSGAGSYEWFENGVSLNEFSNSIIVNSTGRYSVTAANGDCISESEIAELLVIQYPDVTLSTGLNLEICEDETQTVSIPDGAENYEWFFENNSVGQNQNSIDINETGNYFVTAANGNCAATSETVNLNVVQYPEVNFTLSDETELCDGETLTVTAPAGADSYQWFENNTLFAENVNEINVSQSGSYRLTAANADCISESDEIAVTFFSYPNVDLNVGSETTLCEDETLPIFVDLGAENYQWFLDGMPISGANSSEIIADQTGDYHVVAMNHDCESVSDLTTLNLIEYPDVMLSVPTQNMICEGDNLTIEVPAGAETYQWFESDFELPETSNVLTVSGGTDFQVIAANGNCESVSESVQLEVISYPSVELSVPSENTLCEDETLPISVDSGAENYQWFLNGSPISGANTSEIIAEQTGDYHVVAGNYECESVSEKTNLTLIEYPDVTLSVPTQNMICEGESLTIEIPAGAENYQWFENDTELTETSNILTVSESNTYHVVASNGNCVSVSETVQLDVVSPPSVELSVPLENTICEGETLTVSVPSDNGNFEWFYNDSPLNINVFQIDVNQPGNYYVVATKGDCKAVSETFSLEIISLPDMTLSVPLMNEICEDESLIMSIPAGADEYNWYFNGNPIGQNSNEIEVTQSGNYYVWATNKNCPNQSEELSLLVHDFPDVSYLKPVQDTLCEGEILEVAVADLAETYQWFKDGQPISEMNALIAITEPGTYYIQAANGDCTSDSEAFTVYFLNAPDATVSTPLMNEICEGDTLYISVPAGADSYQWFWNGMPVTATTNEFQTVIPGDFHVEVANAECTSVSETVSLEVLDYPDVTLNVPTSNSVCEGESLIISVPVGAENYEWFYDGVPVNVNDHEIEVSAGGEYFVTASNGECAVTSETAFLEILDPPFIDIVPSEISFCEGESFSISIVGIFDSYQWYLNDDPIPGATDPSIVIDRTGVYSVEVTLLGCSEKFDVVESEVFVPQIPNISVDGAILTATDGVLFQWFLNGNPIPGATNPTYEALETGDYSVEITDENGCISMTESVNVIVSNTQNRNIDWSFNLYPNPTDDLIYIELKLPEDVQISKIEILNNLGQKIIERNLENENKQLIISDLNGFFGGVYWVQIFDDEGKFSVKKLIKN